MKSSLLGHALLECWKKNTTPCIFGPPGIGKSSLIRDLALKEYGNFIDIRPGMMSSEDLLGLPAYNHDKSQSHYATPSWLPTDGTGVLFIDEIAQASPKMMGNLSQLILDRQILNYKLPSGWRLAAAANRLEDNAAVNRIPSHVIDRLSIFNLDFNLDDLIQWCINNKIPPAVIAFAKHRPDLLSNFNPKANKNCTPRSLISASKFYNSDHNIRYDLFASNIGEGPAAELVAFLNIWENLPSIDEIYKNPNNYPIPDKADIKFATVNMLAFASNVHNFHSGLTYVSRFEVEYTVPFVKQAIQVDKNIATTKALSDYITKNANILAV